MSESVRISVQHADFKNEDLGRLSGAEIEGFVAQFDWLPELRMMTERILINEDWCPPGLFFTKPSDEYLGIYTAADDRFICVLCLDSRTSLLGRTKSVERCVAPQSLPETLALAKAFAVETTEQIDTRISRLSLVKSGLFG